MDDASRTREQATRPGEEQGLSRMSFLEHLEELRRRLIHAVAAIAVGTGICYYFAEPIFEWLARPVTQFLPEGTRSLTYFTLAAPFFLYIKVAFIAGIFLSSPYLMLQVWLFIRPGLYPRERRWAVPFIVSLSLFFLAGGAFGYWVAVPKLAGFLVQYGSAFRPNLEIGALFSMESQLLLAMALVFEMPVLAFLLARLGILTAGFLIRYLRHAIVALFLVAALITPSGDIPTMLVFALPMTGLYLLCIAVAWFFGRDRAKTGGPAA